MPAFLWEPRVLVIFQVGLKTPHPLSGSAYGQVWGQTHIIYDNLFIT